MNGVWTNERANESCTVDRYTWMFLVSHCCVCDKPEPQHNSWAVRVYLFVSHSLAVGIRQIESIAWCVCACVHSSVFSMEQSASQHSLLHTVVTFQPLMCVRVCALDMLLLCVCRLYMCAAVHFSLFPTYSLCAHTLLRLFFSPSVSHFSGWRLR